MELRQLDLENKSVIGRFAIGELRDMNRELKNIFFSEKNYDNLAEALLTIIQEIESVENDNTTTD